MTDKKFTAKDIFSAILTHAQECGDIEGIPCEVVMEFCEKKLNQLANKATSANSKKAAEDEKYFIAISEVLNGSAGMRATDILKALAVDFENLTIQKVTSMLTKMVASGEVVKTVEKKVSTFALAPAEVAEG